MKPRNIQDLLTHVRQPGTLSAALTGVIGSGLAAGRRPLIRQLSEARFQKLMNEFFPGCELTNGEGNPGLRPTGSDEFDDLVTLLLDHRAEPSEALAWLAFAMATAAMGENHLWQDMGLESRNLLSALIGEHFPQLHALNSANMKWKKFFYRQLCERAGVPICKAPHCRECCDYAACFGPES
ncbi:MAG: nitrogen fixation protein NifQ [Sterolibacteriaceae bacterium MAG5]|nr:nitrogen fixation protein NifQ [Candidatus Nitricoxidireducens bremensis]